MKRSRSLGPAEVDHRKSLSLLRATLESTADGVLVVDNLGKITTYNQQFAEMWRLPPRILASGNDEDALAFVLDQLKEPDQFRKHVKELYSHPGQESFDTIEFRDGRIIRDAAGKVTKVVLVSRDISERKRAEQRERMEHAVTRVLAESETLAEAIPKIVQTICETLNWDCGARWSMDERKKAISCVETWTIPVKAFADFIAEVRQLTFQPTHRCLVRQVWISGTPHWIPDVSRDEGFQRAPLAARAGLHGAFAFPVLAGNVTLAVLEVFSREIRNPDPSLLKMFRVIGSQIGQFLARKQAGGKLPYVATHDTLTGLPNRYMFNQRFAHALNNAQRYRKTMALLFLDLDRFKFINDTLGHPFGDRLLQEAAARLRMCLRESDTIARFGGDEFVALIEDFNEPGDVISVAQKILHALR